MILANISCESKTPTYPFTRLPLPLEHLARVNRPDPKGQDRVERKVCDHRGFHPGCLSRFPSQLAVQIKGDSRNDHSGISDNETDVGCGIIALKGVLRGEPGQVRERVVGGVFKVCGLRSGK